MPCSVARRRRWRRRRRWLVAPSFGLAAAYANACFFSLPPGPCPSLGVSLPSEFDRTVRLHSSFSRRASSSSSSSCRSPPQNPRPSSSFVRPLVYNYTRLTRAATCTFPLAFTQIPRARASRNRTYCYVLAYNISPSTTGIVCARACHRQRPVANERTAGTRGAAGAGGWRTTAVRETVRASASTRVPAWDEGVCIYINT